MSAEHEVLEAAAALVAAFGAHDTVSYFAAFRPDATFLFHTAEKPLRSRTEYEALWAQWEAEDGFRVRSCRSLEQHVQLLPDAESADVAVFTHDVLTTVSTNAGEDTVRERETIVFARQPDGSWLAVHEHLSPAP